MYSLYKKKKSYYKLDYDTYIKISLSLDNKNENNQYVSNLIYSILVGRSAYNDT